MSRNHNSHSHQSNSLANQYRQQSLRSYYTRRMINFKISPLGWVIIGIQAVPFFFFFLLLIFSYIPKTKFIVAMIMP